MRKTSQKQNIESDPISPSTPMRKDVDEVTVWKNPFTVHTPETLNAEEMNDLFVDVFSDFPKLLHEGHTFLQGPRGSGKSMMLRFMQPDCQLLRHSNSTKDLPFVGVYVPMKSTNPNITDLERLDQYASVILNEHSLTIQITANVFDALLNLPGLDSEDDALQIRNFVLNTFTKLLRQNGWKEKLEIHDDLSTRAAFTLMRDCCEDLQREFLQYVKRLSFHKDGMPNYQGALCNYIDFLWPLLKEVKNFSFLPNKPIFIMIDDADNLTHIQTMILNSWVSIRSIRDVCFKISTQMQYKTWRAVSGQNIESPHDFFDIQISTIYTSTKDLYMNRVFQIVNRRLNHLQITPEQFFPPDEQQVEGIKRMGEQIRRDYKQQGVSSRVRDDIFRYSRPMYIASLKGMSKNASTYSYSGFEQLVHISSGIVRFFLEAASDMFDEQVARLHGDQRKPIRFISPEVQNKIVRDIAAKMMDDMDRLVAQPDLDGRLDVAPKLYTLVHSLGNVFHAILVSKRTERRVFSIFFSDKPDEEVQEVLDLGVRQGYFTTSWIGRKEGFGRNKLYILTRRLAPFFTLDVTGFAGYLSVKNSYIRLALEDSKHVRLLKERGIDDRLDLDAAETNGQMELIFEDMTSTRS